MKISLAYACKSENPKANKTKIIPLHAARTTTTQAIRMPIRILSSPLIDFLHGAGEALAI